jgi:signal transduction histidine kinase
MYQKIFGWHVRALLFLVLLIPITAIAQNEKIHLAVDSMKSKINVATGEELFRLYYQIGYELFDIDNPQAVVYSERAYELSKDLSDSLKTRAARTYGQLLRRVDRLDEAITVFNEALAIAEKNNFIDEQKKTLNALALAYNFKAQYDRALATNFRSLEIREREGNKEETSVALASIAFVYYKIGNFDQALDFYTRSITLKDEIKSIKGISNLYINIALCHVHLGDYEQSREFVNRAFSSCEDCDDRVIMEGEFCLGMSYRALNDYEQAKEHFSKSYALSTKLNDNRFLTENSVYIGSLELDRKQYDSAVQYLNEAEEIAKASGYAQLLIYSYGRLSRVYTETKEYEKATSYQAKYISLKDSIYNEDLIRNLARAQTNYEERENIKTIAETNKVLELTQQIIQRQREVYFFVGLVAVLSILGTFMFLRYSRALSKAKQELSVMNQTLEKRVEDRTKQLQNVNNELDNFIYKTSHDIRGPLASLKGIANVALLELKDEKAQDYLQKLDASADKLNSILTRLLIVNQINHAVLNAIKINFQELIHEILVFEKKKGIPPRMTITHDIDPDVLLITDRHVLRIILENLIDNAIKYHNSSERIEPFVRIKTSLSPHGVQISVIDNGIGIQERDPQKLFQMFVRASERSESGGIGLYLTKLASERLYARVDFSTTAEKYTCFTVTIPENLSRVLQQKEKEEHEMR